MQPKEPIPPREIVAAEKANLQQDVKSLWDRWDQAQQKETVSDLVRGYNLLGFGMVIAGALLHTFNSGALGSIVAPIVICIGALIVAVKKFKALWLQRSLDS